LEVRTIALANQKGGVGKTTTAVNLAAGLARRGARVLLIDLDPQANATVAFGLRPPALTHTSYTLLCGHVPLSAILRPVAPGLDLIPANLELAGAEMELSTAIGRESVLRDRLADLPPDRYEFVLVDSPPSLGLLNINALAFVREIIIPLQCEFFALHGISLLLRTVDLVRRRLNPLLVVCGVLACMYDPRRSLSRETLAEIERFFGRRVFRTRIRTNVRLAEAPSHGKSIFDYAPDSHGAEDYAALADELLAGGPAVPAAPVPAAEHGA
jgi:chromosome partitioning protein